MTKKAISIESVEIKIGKSVRKLTIAQAKELRDVLNDVFPEDREVIHKHYDVYPRPWQGPYWTTTWTSASPTLGNTNTTSTPLPNTGNVTCNTKVLSITSKDAA